MLFLVWISVSSIAFSLDDREYERHPVNVSSTTTSKISTSSTCTDGATDYCPTSFSYWGCCDSCPDSEMYRCTPGQCLCCCSTRTSLSGYEECALPINGGPSIDDIPTALTVLACYRASSTYYGPTLKLRRSSDNSELDFYADSLGNLATASYDGAGGISFASWIGEDTASVSSWYDQSGNGYHATQNSTSIQPTYNSEKKLLDFSNNAYFVIDNNVLPLGDNPYSMAAKLGYVPFVDANNGWSALIQSGVNLYNQWTALYINRQYGWPVFDSWNGADGSVPVWDKSISGTGAGSTYNQTHRVRYANSSTFINKETLAHDKSDSGISIIGDSNFGGEMYYAMTFSSALSESQMKYILNCGSLYSTTEQPTEVPTLGPSASPSSFPTHAPSLWPSHQPTEVPTLEPSASPSSLYYRYAAAAYSSTELFMTSYFIDAVTNRLVMLPYSGQVYESMDLDSLGLSPGTSAVFASLILTSRRNIELDEWEFIGSVDGVVDGFFVDGRITIGVLSHNTSNYKIFTPIDGASLIKADAILAWKHNDYFIPGISNSDNRMLKNLAKYMK